MSVHRKQKDSLKSIKSNKSIGRRSKGSRKLSGQSQKTITPFRNVFLYVKLHDVVNMPQLESDEKLKIRLTHSNSIVTKMDCKGPGDDLFDIATTPKPTYSMIIGQDLYEDFNTCCDNPLLITLYKFTLERVEIERHAHSLFDIKEEDEEVQFEGEDSPITVIDIEYVEHMEPIAQGYIDLLEFFNTKRTLTVASAYLYPIQYGTYNANWKTIKTKWDIYSVIPLLKSCQYSNVVFITLESIYNASPELMEIHNQLIINLSLESTTPDDNLDYPKIFLCSYKNFTKSIIAQQNSNIKWESLCNEELNNMQSLSVNSGCKVNTDKLFHSVLGPEDIDFNYDNINIEEDEAIICNSLHRFVLTAQMSKLLEDAIAFNKQILVIDVYDRDNPEEILLTGKIDLSIFLYPQVSVCRLSFELTPPKPKIQINSKPETAKTLKSKNILQNTLVPIDNEITKTFGILNICLISPITVSDDVTLLKDDIRKEKLARCTILILESLYKQNAQVCEETYKSFNELIRTLILYIIENDVQEVDEAKNYFCCQLQNLSNQMIKLIACDFNLRTRTNTNIQFCNMLTTVYYELTQRVYNILEISNNSAKRLPEHLFQSDADLAPKQIVIINMLKYLYDYGNMEYYEIIYKKLCTTYQNCIGLNFFLFVYDVEKHNFSPAIHYLFEPLSRKKEKAEYITDLIALYVNFKMKYEPLTSIHGKYLKSPTEYLLIKLRKFIERYPKDIDAWILLYCIYATHGYTPGTSYTRKRFEELYKIPRRETIVLPISRWEIYNSYQLTFTRPKDKLMYTVFNTLVTFGLYGFADIVFAQLSKRCTEIEVYIIQNTLKILMGAVDSKFETKQFVIPSTPAGLILTSYVAHVNGHIQMALGKPKNAANQYNRLVHTNLHDDKQFILSFLRNGSIMFKEQNYQMAIQSYEKSCLENANNAITLYEIGRSFYRLGNLEEANFHLCNATRFSMHIPDVWAFLALINLKLKRTFEALEYWKYAKLNNSVICEEILSELNRINPKDVDLFIDYPK